MASWTIDKLKTMLKSTGMTVRHDHIDSSSDITEYIVWYSNESSNFMADGETYVSIPTFYVELVETGGRKPSREDVLTDALKANEISYNLSSAGWNQEEDAYIVIYKFQLIIED